jgi:hypothetical protein
MLLSKRSFIDCRANQNKITKFNDLCKLSQESLLMFCIPESVEKSFSAPDFIFMENDLVVTEMIKLELQSAVTK